MGLGLLKGKLSKVQQESCRKDDAQNGTSVCYERPKLKVIVVCLRFLAGIKDGERAVSLLLVISIGNPNGVSFAPCGSHRR